MRLSDIYAETNETLRNAKIEDSAYEASLILGFVLGMNRTRILIHPEVEVENGKIRKIRRIADKRVRGVPMAYIFGYRDFYRDRLRVGSGTLIPRSDTEHLVETVLNLKLLPNRVLEVGVGSGAILISLASAFPKSFFTGLDVHLRDAKHNLRSFVKASQVELIRKSVFHWKMKEPYDLVVSNPPYLSDAEMAALPVGIRDYEPHRALWGGSDGLKFYRFFAKNGRQWLREGGWMVLEVDTKWKKVAELFEEQGARVVRVVRDYQNLERVLVLQF